MINLFKFIESKKGYPIPLLFKLLNSIPLTKDELHVKGNLYLNGSEIKELPPNLKVDGSLDLRNTEIKELPNNLKIGGSLSMENTKIKELPDDLEVGGDIIVTSEREQYFKDNFPKFRDKIR